MPKLSDEQRESVNRRLAVHARIRAAFEGRRYVSQYCFFCNWASNGLTLDEAAEANQKHEDAHPEIAEYDRAEISLQELQDSFHIGIQGIFAFSSFVP